MADNPGWTLIEGEPVIPVAHSVQVMTCGHCPCVHILLLGENDAPMAQATLGREVIVRINRLLVEAERESR